MVGLSTEEEEEDGEIGILAVYFTYIEAIIGYRTTPKVYLTSPEPSKTFHNLLIFHPILNTSGILAISESNYILH